MNWGRCWNDIISILYANFITLSDAEIRAAPGVFFWEFFSRAETSCRLSGIYGGQHMPGDCFQDWKRVFIGEQDRFIREENSPECSAEYWSGRPEVLRTGEVRGFRSADPRNPWTDEGAFAKGKFSIRSGSNAILIADICIIPFNRGPKYMYRILNVSIIFLPDGWSHWNFLAHSLRHPGYRLQQLSWVLPCFVQSWSLQQHPLHQGMNSHYMRRIPPSSGYWSRLLFFSACIP